MPKDKTQIFKSMISISRYKSHCFCSIVIYYGSGKFKILVSQSLIKSIEKWPATVLLVSEWMGNMKCFFFPSEGTLSNWPVLEAGQPRSFLSHYWKSVQILQLPMWAALWSLLVYLLRVCSNPVNLVSPYTAGPRSCPYTAGPRSGTLHILLNFCEVKTFFFTLGVLFRGSG